jgi:hypothetical protein
VFRAWDSELHRDVALKLLHDGDVDSAGAHARLMEEARRLARLRHEHVVQVYGAESTTDASVLDRARQGRALSEVVGARAGAGLAGLICRRASAVHAPASHRDVKAQNVMREVGAHRADGLRNRRGISARAASWDAALSRARSRRPEGVGAERPYTVGVMLFTWCGSVEATMEQRARTRRDPPLRFAPDVGKRVHPRRRARLSDPPGRQRASASGEACAIAQRCPVGGGRRRRGAEAAAPIGLPFVAAATVL